jgi:hypothetical protein
MHILLHEDGVGTRRHGRAGEDADRRPNRQRARGGMARGHALDHGEPRLGGRIEIGVTHGIAVDRRIIERRQIDGRHHVARDHAPVGGGERHRLDLGDRRHALADDAFDLVHRQQRTREGEAVVRELRHQPRSACAGTAWMGVACRIKSSAMRSMS